MAERPAGTTAGLTGKIKKVAAASAVGLFLGELISLLQTMVLARLLTPAEVGLFAAGTVFTVALTDVSDGGVRAGLVQRNRELADAAETVFRGTIITGVLMTLGAIATAPIFGSIFQSPTVGAIAAASSGGLLMYSLMNVPEAMLQRAFSVRRRLVIGPSVSATFAVVSIVLAMRGWGVWSLVAGNYASYTVRLALVWALTGWRPGQGRFSWRLWKELARFGFPLVLNFGGYRAQQAVEATVVGRVLSTTALGHYRYALRIAKLPVSAIVEVVSNALFPAFSRLSEEPERLRARYLTVLRVVTVFASVLSGLMIAAGEPAVVVLLGEPWRPAGIAVMAMAGVGVGRALTCVNEEAMKGSGRSRLLNWLTGTELVVGIGTLALIIPFGLFGVGLAVSTTELAVAVVSVAFIRRVVGVTVGQVGRAVLPPVVVGLIPLGGTWLLEHRVLHADAHGLVPGLGLLVLDVLVFVAVYAVGLKIVSPDTVRELLPALPLRRWYRRPTEPTGTALAEHVGAPTTDKDES
jgi:PST family polysaccharide transporter